MSFQSSRLKTGLAVIVILVFAIILLDVLLFQYRATDPAYRPWQSISLCTEMLGSKNATTMQFRIRSLEFQLDKLQRKVEELQNENQKMRSACEFSISESPTHTTETEKIIEETSEATTSLSEETMQEITSRDTAIIDGSRTDLLQTMLSRHPKFTCPLTEPFEGKTVWVHSHSPWDEGGNFTFESKSLPYMLHRIQFDISDLKRPMYQWYGNDRFCDGFKTQRDVNREDILDEFCIKDFYLETKFPSDIWKEISEDEASKWMKDMYPGDTYTFEMITARNAIVKEDLWACGEQMFPYESCGWRKRMEKRAFTTEHFPKKKIRFMKKIYNVAQAFGYWHWLAENLPRLVWFVDELAADPDIWILTNTKLPYIPEYLNFLGVTGDRYIPEKVTKIHAEEVWLTESIPCTYGRRWSMCKLNQVLRQKGQHFLVPEKEKHILIARRTKQPIRRNIKNWQAMYDAIIAAHPDEKIMVFDDAHSTFDRYSQGFANAWLIISVFGAGEANMVFSEAGTVTIEITSHSRGFLYLRQALTLGHRFFGYAGKGTSGVVVIPEEIATIVGWYVKARKSRLGD